MGRAALLVVVGALWTTAAAAGPRAVVAVGSTRAKNRTYDFTAMRTYLNFVAPFYGNLSMTIGDATGAVFEYSNVGMTPNTRLGLASGSKWPGVTALVACFAAHNVSFDTPMHTLVDFWDAQGAKASVTLRHVLSMTTGLISEGDTASSTYGNCTAQNLALPACAELMYAALPPAPYAPPGTLFMYSTFGFQFAAAAAVAVASQPIGAILDQYLLTPARMAPTCFWTNQDLNPVIGGGLVCSARMMDRFNHAMLVDAIVDEATRIEMETVRVTPDMYGGGTAIFGPYCMGNWLECLNNGQGPNGTLPKSCLTANRHGHPGCGGYWNFVDRSQGIYFNFLPSYACSEANNWCDSFQGQYNCPPLYGWAMLMRTALGFYLDEALLV